MAIIRIENLTNPGMPPVDGDSIRKVFDNGSSMDSVYVEIIDDSAEVSSHAVSVAAFMTRLDVNGKIDLIYARRDLEQAETPPVYTVYKLLDNLRRRTYINLDDPSLLPTLQFLNIYDETEIAFILKDASDYEEPTNI